ncbi:hypothetical protein AUJ42_01090 [Candidatus Collierbacteria bacterium CG1_02_44_10]|uniref:Helicase/UvrB N-terminal domain-containing protein n=2 Tax=Candidatus Collieribacteriota TaxID=1752725 RepID=A0A2H0VJ25_9BACT|nr:MAG: hypothetical protein AUJ42_01090 [Candidatus Collierbacteria bacterium CG1_02_44_10]PIR99083.1 MAG: hypothetical protein COT87_01350 [Candidatus Collierbacteria bacterium CG10_big_fil_rev_8_21_14_0_10_44_9]
MQLIKNFITTQAFSWSQEQEKDQNSLSGYILRHIKSSGKLRDAQIEAIRVYLYLKVHANNKPLIDVLADNYDGGLQSALADLSLEINNPSLKKLVNTTDDALIRQIASTILGGYDHIQNTLYSLPMGAGKTFVMASMLYIDLYFNMTSDDKRFAKNFLIFAPSGLKSSVIPSLRSIERFDPTWVLPKDIATTIKNQLHFIVLDENATAKKSNRTLNPNAQKVMECLRQSDPKGYIFVTNAEKVILDKVIVTNNQTTFLEDDEKGKQENELRHTIAQIPDMTILVDEVHHVQENKLKAVIDKQFNTGNLRSVVGFTGTPYFKRKVALTGLTLKLDQIANTIYHYDLQKGVRNFLKNPLIKKFESDTDTIVKSALSDFYDQYYSVIYQDGRLPKLAIYCANIDRLQNQILPIVTAFYADKNLDTSEILTYFEKSPKEDQIEFAKLDTIYSKKRIILLCQIGKEGWDCQSLTGVVLSGESDSPKNMVLQTSCRCLREVDDASSEQGLIYLNESNYKHLESELMDTHKITIKEFEEGVKDANTLLRVDRRKQLDLPDLEYKQFEVEYTTDLHLQTPDTTTILAKLLADLGSHDPKYYKPVIVKTSTSLDLADKSKSSTTIIQDTQDILSFGQFVLLVLKSSLSTITFDIVAEYLGALRLIYDSITVNERLVAGYDLDPILTTLHTSFTPETHITTREIIKSETVSWLKIDTLNRNPIGDKYYPTDAGTISNILNNAPSDSQSRIDQFEQTIKLLSNHQATEGLQKEIDQIKKSNLSYENKDRSFHYIPYEFSGSTFEQSILETIYQLDTFSKNKLEVYFNGDRFLSTFKIHIYKKFESGWRLIQNNYTPDFLLIQRDGKHKIKKTLIIETKGSHLAGDFTDIKSFMEGKFSEINPEAYKFFYIEDGAKPSYYEDQLQKIIQDYFGVK